MMFRTCGAAAQPPVRVASFPTVQVDDHSCPRPRARIRHDNRDGIPATLLRSSHSAQENSIFSLAVTLQTRFIRTAEGWSALAWTYRNTGALPSIPSRSHYHYHGTQVAAVAP